MATFDTPATAQEYVNIDEVQPNTNLDTLDVWVTGGLTGNATRGLVNFKVPEKPTGVNRIDRMLCVLVLHESLGGAVNRFHNVYKISQIWTEASATWNNSTGGVAWQTAGGDKSVLLTSRPVAISYGERDAYDVTSMGLDWGGHGSVLIQDSGETGGAERGAAYFDTESVGTVAWMPHVVITATDDPPASLQGVTVSPDVSLSESSYTYRQRAIISWTESDENDFKRYRIRKGVNRSQASDHTHLAFVRSRASTTYLDPTLYTDGSTIYYAIYPEDTRNGSTSTFLGATYTNVSNIVSWTKPAALIGRVSPSSSASVLDSVEVNVRQTNDSVGIGSAMGSFKRAKIIWADKSYSVTGNLTSAGGYAYARHRYTAASATLTVRALVEDLKGFRSGLDSYATTIAITSP